MQMQKRLTELTRATIVGASLLMVASQAHAESGSSGTLTVSGSGQVTTSPDRAEIQTGVVTQAATAAKALADNNKTMSAIIKGLGELNIDAKDTQTSQFSVSPIYTQTPNNTEAPKISGYEVTNALTVKVKKVADVGIVLDRLVSLGSNRIQGVNFSVSDPSQLLDKARQGAVEDALRKAKIYAEAGGVSLGRIESIVESGGGQPYPKMVRLMAADAAVPVAPGEQTIDASVTLVIDIQ